MEIDSMEIDSMEIDSMEIDSMEIDSMKIDSININSEPNSNNLFLAFPRGIYQLIFKTCFLHPIHIILGFYYEMYLCGIMGIILFGTSLNYWYNPNIKSLARYIDMIAAFTIVPYHLYLSFFTDNKIICTGILISGISMYPLSLFLQYNLNYIKRAALCHCLLHIFVSIGVCFVYKAYYEQDMSKKWNI